MHAEPPPPGAAPAPRTGPSPLKGLIALNAVLLLLLGAVVFAPVADAQRGGQRPRGEYTMVAASAQGFSEDALYVVDASNLELVVLRYDRSRKGLAFVGFRDLAEDARRAAGRSR